jgi:multidrug resistance efflux pump
VKIAIDPNDPLRGELRPGMSVTATVDTKAPAPGPSLMRSAVVH